MEGIKEFLFEVGVGFGIGPYLIDLGTFELCDLAYNEVGKPVPLQLIRIPATIQFLIELNQRLHKFKLAIG